MCGRRIYIPANVGKQDASWIGPIKPKSKAERECRRSSRWRKDQPSTRHPRRLGGTENQNGPRREAGAVASLDFDVSTKLRREVEAEVMRVVVVRGVSENLVVVQRHLME